MASSVSRATSAFYHGLVKFALKFGVVGMVGYVVDVGIFNALRLGVAGDGHFFQGPIGAKIIASSIAIVVTWFGNRYWTFRENRRQKYVVEFLEFGAIAVAGMGINLLCLYVSHYVLGHSSLLADNISANVIGLFIATAFRFVMYRFWVYSPGRSDGLATRRNQEPSGMSTDTSPIQLQA